MDISLSSSVTVSAAISNGVKSYTTSSGSGTALTVNLDISTAESLFVPTAPIAGDLSAATELTVLQNMETILLKPIYVNNNKATAASTSDGLFSATATLSAQ